MLRTSLFLAAVTVAGLAWADAPSIRLPWGGKYQAPKPHKVAPYAPRPQDLVILYEHADFGGRGVGLDKDTLDLQAVQFNDMVCSFKVRRGHQATFYEDVNGTGE